jgi:radical SAM protein with 4Fe4S-binding SPASM domain
MDALGSVRTMNGGTALRPAIAGVKDWVKAHAPSPVLRRARILTSMLRAYHYWVPYNVFPDGRAWPPTLLTLDLTYICNLKCEMCPQAIDFEKAKESNLLKQYRSHKELTSEQILCLIDDAAAFGVKTFTFTGGEPFLRKDLMNYVERVKARGMACQIYTNGMLITPAIAARLVALGVERVTISVDGPEHIHNTIRKHNKSFQKLMEAVDAIQAEKKRTGRRFPSLLFANTISASNASTMSELMDVAGQHGVNVNFGYLYYVSEAMEEKTARILEVEPVKGEDQNMPDRLKHLDADLIGEQIKIVRQKEQEYGVVASFTPDLRPRDIRRRYEDDTAAPASKCYYAWHHARVNPYGELYACGPISISMGNVTEQGLAGIWNNDQFRRFRRLIRRHRLFPKCTKCCALNETAWRYLPALMR